jgi:hypothetical protein
LLRTPVARAATNGRTATSSCLCRFPKSLIRIFLSRPCIPNVLPAAYHAYSRPLARLVVSSRS